MAYDDPQGVGVTLSLHEATPLATALVARIAAMHDVRLLTLKGPYTAEEGLRPQRASYDVDLLLHPHDADRFIASLARLGWQQRPRPNFPTLLPPHSASLIHPGWPVDLDVHWNWPGFLVSDAEAFETLWATHRTVTLAGAEIRVPSRADSALILALHVLRESKNLTQVQRRRAEYEFLLDAVRAEPETQAQIVASASQLQAVRTAQPFLAELSVDGVPELIEAAVAEPMGDAGHRFIEWQRHQASDHAVAGWVHQLSNTPLWRKPAVIWRATFPSPHDLRAIDPLIGDGALSLMRGWWRRTRRGFSTARAARKTLHTTGQAQKEAQT